MKQIKRLLKKFYIKYLKFMRDGFGQPPPNNIIFYEQEEN